MRHKVFKFSGNTTEFSDSERTNWIILDSSSEAQKSRRATLVHAFTFSLSLYIRRLVCSLSKLRRRSRATHVNSQLQSCWKGHGKLLEIRTAFASTSDPSGSRRATNRVTTRTPRPKSLSFLLCLSLSPTLTIFCSLFTLSISLLFSFSVHIFRTLALFSFLFSPTLLLWCWTASCFPGQSQWREKRVEN